MTTLEQIRKAVLGISKAEIESTKLCCVPVYHESGETLNDKKWKAMSAWAGCKREDVAVWFDNSLMGGCKKGSAFTTGEFWSNEPLLKIPKGFEKRFAPLRYSEIRAVRWEPQKSGYFTILFDEGEAVVYAGIYGKYLAEALNRILSIVGSAEPAKQPAAPKAPRKKKSPAKTSADVPEILAPEYVAILDDPNRGPGDLIAAIARNELNRRNAEREATPAVEAAPEPQSPSTDTNDRIAALERELAALRAQAAAEEEAKHKAAEEEAKRKAVEEEAKRKAAEEEAKRKAAEEEAKRKAAEEEAKRKAAEEEAKRKAAEEEAKRKAAEEEAKRQAAEEAAKQDATKEDPVQLFQRMERAAKGGNVQAMYNLSILYGAGKGTDKNLDAAFHWMRKAALGGYSKAYHPLALLYLGGSGTEENPEATHYWARKAVESGDASAEPLLKAADKAIKTFLASLEVGDQFPYGHYPQAADGGVEPIVWRVLDKQVDKILVLSEKVLDRVPFSKASKENLDPSWADASIRSWLHKEFWEQAFAEVDTARILNTTVKTTTNPDYDWMVQSLPQKTEVPERVTTPCPDTVDRLFLLSWEEVIRYLAGGKKPTLQCSGFIGGERRIKGTTIWYNFDSYDTAASITPYAAQKITGGMFGKGQAFEKYGTGDWWLRTTGTQNTMLYVYCGEDIDLVTTISYCMTVKSNRNAAEAIQAIQKKEFDFPKPGSIQFAESRSKARGVRPAMWISLK